MAGAVFGWSQIEFILKDEGIFYDEYCGNNADDNTADNVADKISSQNVTLPFNDSVRGPEFCSDALNYYSSTYTWMLISQLLGPLIFGILIPIIGTAPTRIIGSVQISATTWSFGPRFSGEIVILNHFSFVYVFNRYYSLDVL